MGAVGEMREKYLTQNENGQRTDKEWTKVTKVLQVGSAESPNSSLFVFVRCFPFRFGNSLPHNLCSLFSKSCAICVLSSRIFIVGFRLCTYVWFSPFMKEKLN